MTALYFNIWLKTPINRKLIVYKIEMFNMRFIIILIFSSTQVDKIFYVKLDNKPYSNTH